MFLFFLRRDLIQRKNNSTGELENGAKMPNSCTADMLPSATDRQVVFYAANLVSKENR
jgi:hypothetical protein